MVKVRHIPADRRMGAGWSHNCNIKVLWLSDLTGIICCDKFCYNEGKIGYEEVPDSRPKNNFDNKKKG
jgi:hypothetical protein